MSNIFNDLNKLVNTVQKVDKLLSEKPKRKRTKVNLDLRDTPFDQALRPLCDWLASRPQNELIGNLNAIVDNLNEFGTDYTITLKTK